MKFNSTCFYTEMNTPNQTYQVENLKADLPQYNSIEMENNNTNNNNNNNSNKKKKITKNNGKHSLQ